MDTLTLTAREWNHWLRCDAPLDGCRVCQHVRRCVHRAQKLRTDPTAPALRIVKEAA